ncbi:MAG: hypothetical protein IJE51_00025, partial [Clostridia bacterium]|nr:hypothetical protein [Clostridia bacterium]
IELPPNYGKAVFAPLVVGRGAADCIESLFGRNQRETIPQSCLRQSSSLYTREPKARQLLMKNAVNIRIFYGLPCEDLEFATRLPCVHVQASVELARSD